MAHTSRSAFLQWGNTASLDSVFALHYIDDIFLNTWSYGSLVEAKHYKPLFYSYRLLGQGADVYEAEREFAEYFEAFRPLFGERDYVDVKLFLDNREIESKSFIIREIFS